MRYENCNLQMSLHPQAVVVAQQKEQELEEMRGVVSKLINKAGARTREEVSNNFCCSVTCGFYHVESQCFVGWTTWRVCGLCHMKSQ